jgi:hypothetical protein
MYDELSAIELMPAGTVCERRSRYRRNWYAEHDDPGHAHPITENAERRARSGRGRARYRRLLALSERLASAPLPDALRAEMLELEEALNAHWLEVAGEHFNLGVEAGLLRAALTPDALAELPARERLRALVAALALTIDEL